MSYEYVWTPSSVKPDNNSVVTIKTWDGKEVPNSSITVSGFSVRVVVPRPNKYSLSIRSDSLKESVRVNIPTPTGSNGIEDRMKNYTDEKIRQSSGGDAIPGGLVIDTDNEGFFKIVNG